jgi:hypothetical protein
MCPMRRVKQGDGVCDGAGLMKQVAAGRHNAARQQVVANFQSCLLALASGGGWLAESSRIGLT